MKQVKKVRDAKCGDRPETAKQVLSLLKKIIEGEQKDHDQETP